jgi:hypothetical protein
MIFIIKKVMKNLIVLGIIVLLLNACASYNNTVHSRYISRDPVGYDTIHLVNNHPTPIYDSIYVVSPTWKQAYKKSNKWVTIGGTSVTVGSLLVAPFLYNPTTVAPVAIGGLVITGSNLEWYRWNNDKEIKKSEYDSLMKADGNLKAFWNKFN